MAAPSGSPMRERCAIITGANKGIGFETCKQLAEKGILVVLTARDEKRGSEALQRLKDVGGEMSSNVVFHQLDVMDPTSIAHLVDFVKSRFGKLDILINNAGLLGVGGDVSAIQEKVLAYQGTNEVPKKAVQSEENAIFIENYELAERCMQTSYYGCKRMTEAFIPLLQLSYSPRIVNISSVAGKLEYISNGWATEMLGNFGGLTEERVDTVVNELLKEFKDESSVEATGWPPTFSAYIVSKAALNAYTRVVAKKFPNIIANCLCPGFVKTDMSYNVGRITAEEGAKDVVKLAMLPPAGPSGLFFVNGEVSSF